MRNASALQILRCLREHLGEEVNIRRICSQVSLSYQPTYAHVRALEAQGVVQTRKEGREVLCSLRPSPATYLWLGLAEEESLPAWAPSLVALARSLWGEHLLFLVLERAEPPRWGGVGLPEEDAQGLAMLSLRCLQEWGLALQWQGWSRGAFRRAWQEKVWRQRLRREAQVLYGRERFWEWMVEAAAAPLEEEPLPPEPFPDFVD